VAEISICHYSRSEGVAETQKLYCRAPLVSIHLWRVDDINYLPLAFGDLHFNSHPTAIYARKSGFALCRSERLVHGTVHTKRAVCRFFITTFVPTIGPEMDPDYALWEFFPWHDVVNGQHRTAFLALYRA
jgi:hypothetical protein